MDKSRPRDYVIKLSAVMARWRSPRGGIVTFKQVEYAGGYLPPAVGGRFHLRRDRLVGTLIRAHNAGHRLFLIEGQAGQGKSTLAAQFIDERAPQSLWYPLVANDRDPAWFIPNLLRQLKQSLSGFSSPFLEEMVAKGELVAMDCHAYGERLADALRPHPPLTIAFDDLHLLGAESPSVAFLKGFVGTRVPERTLLLLSRYPLAPLLFGGHPPVGSTRISGEALAMNRGEIADCLATLFRLHPTQAMVAHIHDITQGWVMGVLARAHALHAAGGAATLASLPEVEASNFLNRELVESFPQAILPLLTDLSWGDTIPLALAETLSGRDDIPELFSHLVSHNFFTRFTSDDKTEAVFHHHLQHCLRERSRALRSDGELRHLFATLARWYEIHGKPEDAARFFLDAGNHDEVERLIRDRGLALCSAGRLETLRRSISRMPEAVIKARGWLACNYGIALMEVDPPKAFAFLTAAEGCFQAKEDALGLLIARVQRLYYHTWVDALFNEGKRLLEPVHQAFRTLEGTLSDQIRLKTLYCLACGYIFFDGDLTSGARCADEALTLALKKGYDNAACEIRIIRCYLHVFKGDWRRFNLEMEPLVPLLSSPRVSSCNRVIGWLTLLKILLMEGDTDTYRHHRDLTAQVIANETLFHEMAAPFIRVWDMDAALSDGDYLLAGRIATEAGVQGHTAMNPHMKSQLLHYHAFALAMLGEHRSVPAICREALAQRLESGSPYFTALTQSITGAALTFSGEHAEAEPLLLAALDRFEAMEETFERAGVHAHLGHLYGITGRHALARTHTAHWLHLMNVQHYRHHVTWTPSMLGTLLDRAVSDGIETETATALARTTLRRGYTPQGKPVPLLAITTFGSFSIALKGRDGLTLQELTPNQQRLVALLLSRRDATVPVEEIQTLFWPETSPQKGRASLDTMVSRLKKALKKAVAPHNPGDFLSVKKEKLTLANVTTDAWRFADLAEEGLQLFRARAFWQAANRFRTAFSLVKGPYLAGFGDDGTCHEHREYLLRPLIHRAALAWISAISCIGLPPAHDLAVIEGLITGDPECLSLVRSLHRLRTEKDHPHRAASLLRTYRDLLTRDGMPPSEVESLLEGIWT